MIKYMKFAAVILCAGLVLTACSSKKDEDKDNQSKTYSTGSMSIMYMPSDPAASGTGSELTSGAPSGQTSGGNGSGSSETGSGSASGASSTASFETVSTLGEISTRKQALDLVKDHVLPVQFQSVPKLELKVSNDVQRYVFSEKDSSGQEYKTCLEISSAGNKYYMVSYYREKVGSMEKPTALGGYRVYKDGHVEDLATGEQIGLKK